MKARPDKTQIVDEVTANNLAAFVFTESTPAAKVGRPIDEAKARRVRYNTMLDEQMRKRIKIHAALNDISTADVINAALDEYMKQHGM
jgi:hypothetical protein